MEIIKGDVVVGKVTGLAKFGLFVQVNEKFSGLVHISEVSTKFVDDISKYAKIGDYILVKVIGIKNNKLTLSIKGNNYKVKESCLNIPDPELEYNKDDFTVLKNKLDDWISDYKR